MGLTCMQMYAEAYLEPSGTFMAELLCKKSQESFIVEARLGSKYAFGIGFMVEKVNRMSIFISYGQSQLQKFVIAFLFLELIKNMSI